MASKHKANMNKFPAYSLPKLYGWHLIPKQDLKTTGKVYKYFGANWWDLLYDGKLSLHKGSITLKTKNAHAIIFINLGSNHVRMVDMKSKDVYNVPPGQRSTVNNTQDRQITFKSDDTANQMHLTKIGNVWLVLLQVQQIKDGAALTKKSVLFSDFLLMTGVPDKDQYLNTVGIENLEYMNVKGWKFQETEAGIKSEFVEGLLEHWDKVSPKKGTKAKNPIPEKVHWIWFRLHPKLKKYGKLKPKFYKFMETWINRNPGFEFNIWTDNPDFILPKRYEGIVNVRGPNDVEKVLNKLPAGHVRKNIKYMFNNHLNVGARSDTFRQVLLYFEGGVYGDINDGACNASLGKMFQKFDYMIGMEPVVYVNNAIIASAPKHIITKNMIAWLAGNAHDFVEEWAEDYADADQEERDDYIVSTTGPIALTQVIYGVMKEHLEKLDDTVIMPSSWLYGNYWITESPENWLKPVSICSHYDGREYLK